MEQSAYRVELPLKATSTSLQLPFFLADSPYINSCFNLSTMATFFGPQAKVAVVERVNCNFPSLGPDSALWEKGEEIGVCEKKNRRAKRAER